MTKEERKEKNLRALLRSLKTNVADETARLSSIFKRAEDARQDVLDAIKEKVPLEKQLIQVRSKRDVELNIILTATKKLGKDREALDVLRDERDKERILHEKNVLRLQRLYASTQFSLDGVVLEKNKVSRKLGLLDKEVEKKQGILIELEETREENISVGRETENLRMELSKEEAGYKKSMDVLAKTIETLSVGAENQRKSMRDAIDAHNEREKYIRQRERELRLYESRLRKQFEKLGISMK